MSTAKEEIENFLEANFHSGLDGYFGENESAEKAIVEKSIRSDEDSETPAPDTTPPVGTHAAKKTVKKPDIKVEDDPRGCGKRFSIKITLDAKNYSKIRGQLLRNRARIESNLLAAIHALIIQEKSMWKTSLVGKVDIVIE